MNPPHLVTAYIALGSNLGDRQATLQAAVNALQLQAVVVEARSHLYEAQSVENGGTGDFLNAVVRVRTQLSPQELLGVLQTIEGQMGRTAAGSEGRGGARPLDLDLLFYGDDEVNTAQLQLPHPRMHRRAFVLQPLLDVLEGGWVKRARVDWIL